MRPNREQIKFFGLWDKREWTQGDSMSNRVISDGQLNEFLGEVSKSKWVDKDKVLQDIAKLIRTSPLTSAQIQMLNEAIQSRIKYKTCCNCGKLVPEMAGSLVWLNGDMSKPKRFQCGDCK